MALSKHSRRALDRTGRRNTTSPESALPEISATTQINSVPTFDDLLELGSTSVVSELPAPEAPQEPVAATVIIDGPLRRDRHKSEKTAKPVKSAKPVKTPKFAKVRDRKSTRLNSSHWE